MDVPWKLVCGHATWLLDMPREWDHYRAMRRVDQGQRRAEQPEKSRTKSAINMPTIEEVWESTCNCFLVQIVTV